MQNTRIANFMGHLRPSPGKQATASRQPLPEEDAAEKKQPSKVWRVLKTIGLILLALVAAAVVYLGILLAEPDEDAKYGGNAPEAPLTTSMAAMEIPANGDLQSLVDRFNAPVMRFYGGPEMRSARIYDRAFGNGYARCVSVTYQLEDGSDCVLTSIRPASAASLISSDGFSLATTMYHMGGVSVMRMDSGDEICLVGQSETTLYQLTMKKSSENLLETILKQTYTLRPTNAQND